MKRSLGVIVMLSVLVGGWKVHQYRRQAEAPTSRPVVDVAGTERPSVGPFQLEEAAAAAGLAHTHQRFKVHPSFANVEPWLAGLGAHAAVADVDNDGRMDVYLTNSAKGLPNRLFRNKGDGTFADIGAGSGAADVNREAGSLGALFFDYDNDGKKDLLLLTTRCTRVFRGNGDGTFAETTDKAGVDHCGYSVAANVLDYDADGYLDLVIADYFPRVDLSSDKTSKVMQNSLVAADNGGPIVAYRNNRDGTFSRVKDNLGIKSRGWTLALGAYDIRGTGRPDLYFATDYGGDQLYFNEGGGKFANVSPSVDNKYSRNGMSAEIADVDNDGHPLVMVTNINEPLYKIGENVLWKWTGGKEFKDLAWNRGVSKCGWAWGSKFMDLDNDGWLDLAVANGFISANPKKSYWFTMSTMGSGAGIVMEDAKNWPPMKDASLAGYQRKCLYRNQGGQFREVTETTPLEKDVSDGRGVAAIDVEGDGRLSFLIANQNQPLKFYRNLTRNGNHWLGFSLTGVKSNRDAYGASVTAVLSDGRKLTRQVQPMNGFMSQSDSRVHFGLGSALSVESVEILWPSGAKQTIRKPALDRYHAVREEAS